MEERRFTEVDLREMLDVAGGVQRSGGLGRWIVSTKLRGRSWRIVLEPEEDEELVYVVTAYERETT